MNNNETISLILQALRQDLPIVINGYRSKSGDLTDFTIRCIGSEGYKALIGASLFIVQKGDVSKPPGFDVGTWSDAVAEQCASWNRTLSGQQPEREGAMYIQHPDGYSTQAGVPDLIVLRHVEVLQEKRIYEAEKPIVNSRAKTLAKKYIVEHTPIGRYRGVLHLAPGKFATISVQ